MYKTIILLLFFSCNGLVSNAQVTNQEAVKLQLSGRVDMSNPDVVQVVSVYQNYINSSSDSIYNNPFWNQREKDLYKDFDFSRLSMFTFISSRQLLEIYSPFVLSVEPIKDKQKYQIRVLYANSATEKPYIGSKVWCIHKLSVIKENDKWYLENLLVEETLDWKKQKVGFIEYVYPPKYPFNIKNAEKSFDFCKKILQRFNLGFNSSFRFYITESMDDMGRIENFDFIFAGITTGKARETMILSAKADEFYPHEFIHKLLVQNDKRGAVIEEGLASFLGTKENNNSKNKYEPWIKLLAKDYQQLDTYTLENILNNNTKWNYYQVPYPAGSIICEIIYEQKGDAGLIELMNGSSQNYKEIVRLVSKILNIKEENFKSIWDKKIAEYQ